MRQMFAVGPLLALLFCAAFPSGNSGSEPIDSPRLIESGLDKIGSLHRSWEREKGRSKLKAQRMQKLTIENTLAEDPAALQNQPSKVGSAYLATAIRSGLVKSADPAELEALRSARLAKLKVITKI